MWSEHGILVRTLIRPGQRGIDLAECWTYRELLYFLVWRDVKVRYQQTVLGVAWSVLQPLATMVVFSVFFGRLAAMPSDGLPYPLFSFVALVPWTYFSSAIGAGAQSLVGSKNLVDKVYFPRVLIPAAAVLTPVVDFAIAFVMALLLLGVYGRTPSPAAILVVPACTLLAIAAALAISLWFAALNVEYRDVRYVLPFVIQFWLFVTPVAYPASLVPPLWRPWLGLNPMAAVVEGFRWALLGGAAPPTAMVVIAVTTTVVLLGGGVAYFRRMEGTFADVI